MTKRKNPKDFKKNGRPSKFNDKIQAQIKFLAEKGFIDDEIAISLGITQQTLNNWKKEHPKFFEALKDWKLTADRRVERSLYEKACGYSMPDTKFATHEGQITDSVKYTKHIAPSDTAIIFWLKNRQPEKWRDKTEVDNIHHVTIEDFADEIQKA